MYINTASKPYCRERNFQQTSISARIRQHGISTAGGTGEVPSAQRSGMAARKAGRVGFNCCLVCGEGGFVPQLGQLC